MTSPNPAPAANPADRPYLPLMVLLFIGSGCAALIYEVVWLQMLSLVVGSSAISIGVTLGVFMGGMCAGSLLLAKYVRRSVHPLRVYAMLEAGVGLWALVILALLPLAGGVYTSIGLGGFPGLIFTAIVCALLLLPPTLMMGATLPAISRFVESTPTGASWLGFFYGGNILGGVVGALSAGYVWLRLFDVYTSTFVAFALNMFVAAAGYMLSQTTPYVPPKDDAPPKKLFEIAPGTGPVYATIALSGFTALGCEVVWTRLLSLNLGATTYTFSLILGVFLIGLGIGSSAGATLAGTLRNARTALGWCQFLIVCAIAWGAYALTKALPYWPIDPTIASTSPLFTFQMDFVKSAFTVLPGAILWGASFPLALAAVSLPGRDPGVVVGTTYAANTVGAILGSLLASLAFIPLFGTQWSSRILIIVAGVSALLIFALPALTDAGHAAGRAFGTLVTLVAMVGLLFTIIPVPPLLVGYGRFAARRMNDHGDFIFTGEGMNSSMTVSQLSNGVLNYHNAGKVQASSEPQDMRLQRMLGHMATLLPKQTPKRVLVIGCGAGVTAGSVSIEPRLEQEVIAEIEPLVPKFVSKYFGDHNFHVVDNPKVKVHIDDARHYLLTTHDTFDAITSDPFDPWVKGAASLYTKQFFELVKSKLNDGGVVTVFVQLYESNTAAVKSEVATFFEAFPDGLVFGNTNMGAGYDVVLVGQKNPAPIDVDAIEARLETPEYAGVARSLSEIGFHSAIDLLGTFAARAQDLRPWLVDAQVNLDKNLRLQYLAGFGLNLYDQASIYAEMLQYHKYPEGVFTGSPETLMALRARMQ